MPLYWRPQRRYYYRRNYNRKWRRPLRRRRPRPLIRRRFYRGRWVRRRLYRSFRRKKLKKIRLNQWQPRKIIRCKIKGDIPLFICGKKRIVHNYCLYKESNSLVGESTGGGWSLQLFNLDILYQEFLQYKNYWTKSNQGLPLVRFGKTTLKFYKSQYTDYIVTVKRCPPFTATKDMYLNSHPQRQLMERNKILVPRLTSGTRKKYKKLHLNPPSLLQNKWYFQQEVCKTPLFLINTTACSFEQPFAAEDHVSDSITLVSLDTNTFQNPDFYNLPPEGYIPKHIGTQRMYLVGPGRTGEHPPKKWTDVVFLGNTRTYTEGTEQTTLAELKKSSNWGNPFTHHWTHYDFPIYYTNKFPTTQTEMNSETFTTFTILEHLYVYCRYNPQKDKGTNNIIYLKKNDDPTETPYDQLPRNDRIILRDYPLWIGFWGWTDWIKRVPEVQALNSNWQIVVKSPYIYPPRPYYVFVDKYFYDTDGKDLTFSDQSKWHPKYEFQQDCEFYIGQSGPYTPKINRSELIQADMNYTVNVKWGGCPAPMETIISPCEQEKYPEPNNQLQMLQIQDPKTQKETYLYEWDERRGELTKTGAERIKKDSGPELFVTGLSSLNVPVQTQQTESEEEETSEEEKTPLQQQLQQLKQQQRLLRRQLLRLSKPRSYEL
nr:MAG: ORF1 [TTV-like mini virus]